MTTTVASPSALRPSIPAALGPRIEALLPALAERIDREGFYPEDALRDLGAAGLFGAHLAASSDGAPSLGRAIRAMAEVGRHCMSTAFCTWCQDAAGYYLELGDNPELRAAIQPDLANGRLLGGTGLSNPMKALSGIEEFRLRGVRAEGGWVVSGVLPWVSNLGDGHWFGTVFVTDAKPERRVMIMARVGQDGVSIRHGAKFIALEGTGTYPVMFRRAFIPDSQVLADPAEPMIRRIKAGFILLQTGMGLGVIRGAIDTMHDANRTHAHTNRYLPKQVGEFEAEADALEGRLLALAATPRETSPDYMRAMLQARLETAELSLAASQAGMLHNGARAYVETSPANRRMREAYFVALLTPSTRHLRQELATMSAH